MKKPMSAVEWLQCELVRRCNKNPIAKSKLFAQAKEIEKQQIIDANIAGMEFIAVDINHYNQDAEQYYNETFKNKQ